MLVSQIIDIITFNLKVLLYCNCFDKELLLVEVINNLILQGYYLEFYQSSRIHLRVI